MTDPHDPRPGDDRPPPPGRPDQPGAAGQPPPPPAGYGHPPGYPQAGPPLALTSNGKRFGGFLLEILLAIVTLVIGWLIWWLIVMARGQTPAKQVLKMRCVDANTGQLATYGQMALREVVGKMLLADVTCSISTLVGAIMILADEQRHQALWDKIGTTVVVEDPHDTLAPQSTPLT